MLEKQVIIMRINLLHWEVLHYFQKPSFPRRIYDKMRNEIALNGINLSDEICECYVEIIKKKSSILYGYAASLYLLAKYVDTNGIDLKMDVVFTTSEN